MSKGRKRTKNARAQRSAPVASITPAHGSARFLIVALALMALFYSVYYYPHAPDSALGRFFVWYVELQAKLAGGLCVLLDREAQITGTIISGPIPLRVVKDCSSLDVQALFAATVLAFSARWSSKLLGLLVGIPLLGAINVLRITGLHFVGALAPQLFDAAHEEIFPAMLLVATLALFVLWMRRARPTSEGPHASAA